MLSTDFQERTLYPKMYLIFSSPVFVRKISHIQVGILFLNFTCKSNFAPISHCRAQGRCIFILTHIRLYH